MALVEATVAGSDQPTGDVAAEDKVITLEQLAQAIAEEAGLTVEEMDSVRRTVKGRNGWEIGAPCPLFAQTHVIDSAFVGKAGDVTLDHVPGDIRFYVRPRQLTDAQGNLVPFFCVVVNRAPNFEPRTDIIPRIETFVEDVGREYRESFLVYNEGDDDDDDDDDDEDEDEETYECVCGSEVTTDSKFCPDCGAMARRCGRCATVAIPGHKFCGACGLPLPPPGIAR